jgi:hypothetical protein
VQEQECRIVDPAALNHCVGPPQSDRLRFCRYHLQPPQDFADGGVFEGW